MKHTYAIFLVISLTALAVAIRFYRRQQVITWPLLALAETWRQKATGYSRRAEGESDDKKKFSYYNRADTYREAAKDLEKWIKEGKLTLGS